MIDAYFICNHAHYQWHIPCRSIHHESVNPHHTIPISALFQCHQWTTTQCQQFGVRKSEVEKKASFALKHHVHPTASASKSKTKSKTKTKTSHALPHKQPALFYPTTDHECTTAELPLMQSVDTTVDTMAETVVDDGGDDENKQPNGDAIMVTTQTQDRPNQREACEASEAEGEANSNMCILKPSGVSVPIVSIVMTTYNCAKYIEFAIRSIQLQTLTNWELIVVNDRSTDNTDSLLRTMAQQDDRIVYLHNQHNLGCYASKNIGLRYARGHWLTFQDADDYSMSERLEKQLVFCLHGKQATKPPSPSPQPPRNGDTTHDCCYVMSLSRKEKVWSWVPITMFISANVFRERLGAFDTVRFGADSEIRERMDVLGVRVGVFDDYLYACPDRWVELSSRQQSLTGNTTHNPIRIKYKTAYTRFHNHLRSASHIQKQSRLNYTFQPHCTRPFPLSSLTPDETALFVPDPHALADSLAVNDQMAN